MEVPNTKMAIARTTGGQTKDPTIANVPLCPMEVPNTKTAIARTAGGHTNDPHTAFDIK